MGEGLNGADCAGKEGGEELARHLLQKGVAPPQKGKFMGFVGQSLIAESVCVCARERAQTHTSMHTC